MAPVPLSTMPQYPLYLMAESKTYQTQVPVFLEEFRTTSNIHTATLPRNITSDDTFLFHDRTFKILYHNSAFLGKEKHVQLSTADILTLTAHTPTDHPPQGHTIIAAGHREHQTPPILVGPCSLLDRIEFGINTNGWLATDEMTFALDYIEQVNSDFGRHTGIGVWNHDTFDILPLHHAEFDITSEDVHIMPLLVGSHWMGLRFENQGSNVSLQIISHKADLMRPIAAAVARMLDVAPHHVRAHHIYIPDLTHMCGWQVLYKWFDEAQALQNKPSPFELWQATQSEPHALIHELMDASKEEWTKAQAPGNLCDFACWLRLYYFAKLAQGHQQGDIVLHQTLISTGPTHDPSTQHTPRSVEIKQRLLFPESHPEWLVSDELDFALDFLRTLLPATYFAPPLKWTSTPNTQHLHVFNNTALYAKTYTHCFFFVLHEHHWHLIETVRVSNQLLMFTTCDLQQHELHNQISSIAGIIPDNIQISYVHHPAPPGMCGWNLLWQIFARYYVAVPQYSTQITNTFDLTAEATQINRLRARLHTFLNNIDAHPQCKQLANNIRTLHIRRIVEGRISPSYDHGGANDEASASADKAKDKDSKATKATNAVIDPLFVNDPWAKKATHAPQTKWEDLELPSGHPFQDKKSTALPQLHRLQNGPNRTGIILATRQHLPEISKTTTKEPLAVLVPGADKSVLGDASQHAQGPFEVVLYDKGLQTSYKRLALLWVVQGEVKYSLPAPSIKCNAADFVELVAELDIRVMLPHDFQQAVAEPMATFKRLLQAIHRDIGDNLTMYGLRRNKPTKDSKESHLQVICRVPRQARKQMLEASGQHALMVRDFVEASSLTQDTTVLPKFHQPTSHNLHDLIITSKGVPGAAGITLARRGLALRVWADEVAQARKMYMADDRRITTENAHVVPRHTYESSGWPTSIEASSVIHAVKEATGVPPIPTRAYRAAGVYSWSLAFQTPPDKDRFIVEVGGQLHEILLVPAQNRYNPKAQHQDAGRKMKKQKNALQTINHWRK